MLADVRASNDLTIEEIVAIRVTKKECRLDSFDQNNITRHETTNYG